MKKKIQKIIDLWIKDFGKRPSDLELIVLVGLMK